MKIIETSRILAHSPEQIWQVLTDFQAYSTGIPLLLKAVAMR